MRTDLELLHSALALFAEKGFHDTSMRDIAKRAGVSPGLAYKYHPSKDALAMALYARIADRFEAAAADLPDGTVAARFLAAMQVKVGLITPHRSAMRALTARALDPTDRLGILGPRTGVVRSRNSGVFHLVVSGASDAPADPAEQARIGRLLYGAHLALLLVWTQDTADDNPRTQGALELLAGGLGMLPLITAMGGDVLTRADALFGDALATTRGADAAQRADAMLEILFQRRRLHEGSAWPASEAALALHRPAMARVIAEDRPLTLVLPAFPAKSPSRAKTLGPLPDLAEVLALRSLQALCDELAAVHAPGARLVIASDGHVFADLVEVDDAEVDAYQAAIRRILEDEGLHALSVFDLRDVVGDLRGAAAREALASRYATPVDALKARAKAHSRHQAQYDGIHRFLFEDAVVLHPERSRTANRKVTAGRAWEVVQRSEAWGALVAEALPEALRLSIHPQPQVSEKIGIHLIDTADAWLTPWHAAAVVGEHGARLMKRADAEGAGATLCGDHLVLP
ncbi:MAG: pyoverdine/dityrosine biosynthesis protein Dit1/AcrR family transcriptional regulator [Myxococcota bacterium]|jgi:pyoverdine/dityrosine biosynthesis protein Dit1/AcrR family transcriptional regulator